MARIIVSHEGWAWQNQYMYVLRRAEPVRKAVETTRAEYLNADGTMKDHYKEEVRVKVNWHIV